MFAAPSMLWLFMTGVLLLAPTTTADIEDAQKSEGPVIRPPKSEIILQYGENFTIWCDGKRQLYFKQQEISEGQTGSFKNTSSNGFNETGYWVALDLINVDRFAVGYYACYDDTVDPDTVLSHLVEEPVNSAHISYIYVYVNGKELFAPLKTFVVAETDSKFLIECKPTTPDIKVQLMEIGNLEYVRHTYNPKLGFIVSSDHTDYLTFLCEYEKPEPPSYNTTTVVCQLDLFGELPTPSISKYTEPNFLKGENFTINCTVNIIQYSNLALTLKWSSPLTKSKVSYLSNTNDMKFSEKHPVLYNSITVQNASEDDGGKYTCTVSASGTRNKSINTTFEKIFLYESTLTATYNQGKNGGIKVYTFQTGVIQYKIDLISYPPANVSVRRDNSPTFLHEGEKYGMINSKDNFLMKIKKITAEDTGFYTHYFFNGYKNVTVTLFVEVEDPPRITYVKQIKERRDFKSQVSFSCDAVGHPLPTFQWIFTNKNNISETINKKYQKDYNSTLYTMHSTLTLEVLHAGNVSCKATNEFGSKVNHTQIRVNEIPGGFGIENVNKTWYSQGDNVSLRCLAPEDEYDSVTWYKDDSEIANTENSTSEFSIISTLKMSNIQLEEKGVYTCIGILKGNERAESKNINLTIAKIHTPTIAGPVEEDLEIEPYNNAYLTCIAEAVPPPKIVWSKNKVPLVFDNDTITLLSNDLSRIQRNSTVVIVPMQEREGTYECNVISRDRTLVKSFNIVHRKEVSPHMPKYLTAAGVLFFLLILALVYLILRIRKEKQFRRELKARGLLYFREGATKSLNPNLGIDEQAELLPYNDRFEFPPEKLILGTQLGSGAFGVVYKAEARGIINAEESTIVAVKTVQKTAESMFIKALASELKIMVHIGKHINIVNLLGACTKNVGKCELMVIVEYCAFGNIHNYLLRHRSVFHDQLTDNTEKNLGKVNPGFSTSGNSAMLTHSDYCGSNNTQDTSSTTLNTCNTGRSTRKGSESSSRPGPNWGSSYTSDYSDGRSPRALFSRDLLCWAFQIARGMEYLAHKKVLHGDLAARNILLAEDNVVKICDFGLARSMYKNDEYRKQENSLLPVKWLAIECMTDRIFSTQSDVWSYGVVLWELFSLAKTPYPNLKACELLDWLTKGHRLEKPAHADDKLYEVMMKCWATKPTSRPSFTQLHEMIGKFLDENDRNRYVDLNAAYMDWNIKNQGQEDYLAMVSAPDYNDIVTPDYVNQTGTVFFPSHTPQQLQHDDEGYLQMTPSDRPPSTARVQGSTKFDFNASNPRTSVASSCGSELTPMLRLSKSRSGSDSDQEQESHAPPYMNMCPKIDEEKDDVFNTKEPINKYIEPSATNPMYVTITMHDDKKPNNNIYNANNYININVPNGIVKAK